MNTPYEQIKEFCNNRNATKLQERILLHKFYKDYSEVVESYIKKENKQPSDEIKKGFESSLLSETTLIGNLRLAEEEINEAFINQTKKFKFENSVKNFSLSILSSVLASFIFAFLLVILLNLARNQVKSWVNDLYNTNKQIEQNVNENK